uniref:ODF3A protein n=1 Tax=Catharus ustulatus TaxID=91951 RepID=A0A8C3UX79_CATUS
MQGPWVGTWRPHPRRGPILAEFNTPGPKYLIPGTTGHPGHDPTRQRAPAYSFRGTKSTSTENCSPGPRYFIHSSITNTGKYVPPAAHVTGRYKTKIAVTPGPRTGYPCCSSQPAWLADSFPPSHCTLSHRTDLCSLPIPFSGPGSYSLPRILGPRTVYTRAEPSTYSWTSTSLLLLQTPGPAAFAKVDLDFYKPKAPKYTMGLKTNLAGKDRFPGPADYSLGKVSLIKGRDPAYTFGLRHSLYKASLMPETHLD